MGTMPAAAASAGTISCTVTPTNPVVTLMDVPVSGKVTCTNSKGKKVTLALAPYVADKAGPFNGKLSFTASTGAYTYSPGFYPPDPVTGKIEKLPEFSGPDSFTVKASSTDGAKKTFVVPIKVNAPAHACDPAFIPATQTMFNDPSGSDAQQYQMMRYLIKLIDCTPAQNPDGSQATIRFSFYSLTYAPIQAALTEAAQRGVSVQAITNSHSDKYAAWQELARTLGKDSKATNFATTCWQGCLLPRTAAAVGGPTAWYSAEATSLTSRTVVFRDRSIPGKAPIVSWKYNFGDGKTAKGRGPHKHTYKKYGTYNTTLTVKDANGVTHVTKGSKTVPDNQEPEYPSLHSKVYLFSTVGVGASQRQWVAAYSSGNPTYQQSRKGFNNLNIAVGDKALYDIFNTYMGDLVKASRGELLTKNYFRTFYSPGNAATGAKATTVHFGPQATGDVNLDILKSIQCKYTVGTTTYRTDIKVSMFVLTRKGVASELWQKSMMEGCNVEIVYTQMSQRVKDKKGKWLVNEDGKATGWGAADCLSTKPTKTVTIKATKGKPAKRVTVKNTLNGCKNGTLKGKIPVTKTGTWLDRTSPYGGGRLTVRMACPVTAKYNAVKKTWSVVCIRNDIFTHHKVVLVDGYVRGAAQKYVMTGSANWSGPGLRSSDEVITEIKDAPELYAQYLANFEHMKSIVAKNSKSSAKSLTLQLSEGQNLDVRGMTDAQLEGQE